MPDDPVPDPARRVRDESVRSSHSWAGRHRSRLAGGAITTVVVLAIVAIVSVRDDSGESATSGVTTPPRFLDEAAAAGIDHVYDGDFEFFVGGGVAAFDCDDDGRDELYFAGGSDPAALYRNQSQVGGALRFARQESAITDQTSVTGAYPLDIDSDGNTDLVVLRVGGNVILRGLGDCMFERADDRFGIDGGSDWTVGFSATWEGTNTLPTLAFGSYLRPGDARLDGEACAPSRLVRPEASGERYAQPVPLEPGHCTLSILFSDWSRSGARDLRMANDRHYYVDGGEQLWRIEPGRAPREYGAADGWRPLQLWGMGLASQDLTGDGYPEVFITSQGDNKLQTLDDQTLDDRTRATQALGDGPASPSYRDIALRSGVTAQRPFVGGDVLPSTAWHPEFADVNNDGLVDLFVSKGNVDSQPDFATRDPNNLLIGQADGSFVEGAESAGIVTYDSARGAALVDLNLDGMLDLVVVNRRTNVGLWRNVGAGDTEQTAQMGHWLGIRLRQPEPNVDAVGAWLEVHVGDRLVSSEVTVGGGHASGELGWRHVGIGSAKNVEVRVTWPDGETGPWMTIAADRFVTIEQGNADATAWIPSDQE